MVSHVIYGENAAANGVVMLSRHRNHTTLQTAPEKGHFPGIKKLQLFKEQGWLSDLGIH